MSNKTMAILGIVFAFVIPPVGIILSAIALNKATDDEKRLAKVGLICGIVFSALAIIAGIIGIVVAANAANRSVELASETMKSITNNIPKIGQ